MTQSLATKIASAVKSDLSDYYADGIDEEGIDDVEVSRSYHPIYDIASRTPAELYVTVYDETTDIERASRAGNQETSDIYVALQMRFSGEPSTDLIDHLRYELEQIANRYTGKNAEAAGRKIRAQEATFGTSNDPDLIMQQNAYYGAVVFTFLDRGEIST